MSYSCFYGDVINKSDTYKLVKFWKILFDSSLVEAGLL